MITGLEIQMLILQKDKSIYVIDRDKMSQHKNSQEGKRTSIHLGWEAGLFSRMEEPLGLSQWILALESLWKLSSFYYYEIFQEDAQDEKEPPPVNTDSVCIYLHWLTQSCMLPISQAYWKVISFTEYHCHYEAHWSASIWEPEPALTQH